ncbi:hypothetical protein H0H93_010664 [Arthromyces matolae]|nr:hypothetical protein H0H93_010664 [Arthromyces matolae]
MTIFVPNGLLGAGKVQASQTLDALSNAHQSATVIQNSEISPASDISMDTTGNHETIRGTETVPGPPKEPIRMNLYCPPITAIAQIGPALFIPNGLLSANAPTKDADASTTKSVVQSDTFSVTFVPNGLLSSAPKTIATTPASDTLEKPIFVTNGLLSSTKAANEEGSYPTSSSGWSHDTSIVTPLAATQEGNLSFEPLSQDDDYLPSVQEAFGIPEARSLEPTRQSGGTQTSSRFSIRATTSNGKPVHFKRKLKATRSAHDKLSSTTTTQRMANLLSVPIHRLMDQLSANKARSMQECGEQAMQSAEIEDTLWVDRYRPQKFTELMGNERVAREIMTWIKRWDWCVFGNKKSKKRPHPGDENADEMDEYHRPREKLLLLSGPPGLGKTTMAHVIARQAGYEVMEINASDARSGSIVDDRIRPALESGLAVGSSKPVLLIIDEIDGATGAGENSNTFISKLVSLTFDRPRKKRQKQKDPNTKRPILRPIICICNDQNASSLAKLKPHALQIRIQRPADVHTVNRLREICELEGLKAESRALSTLVGVAKGDLRGCLNTLQFIKARNQEVTESIVRGATVGMKEAETSLNTVLNNIFNPLTKKRVKELALTEEERGKYVARLSREIDGSGRESAIAVGGSPFQLKCSRCSAIAGCFGHYASLRQHDSTFDRYEKANEWLVTFDVLSSGMYNNGDFALSPYLAYTLVPFYPLFQERGGVRVERNQEDWEHLQLTRSNEEILKTVSRGLRSASTHFGGDFRHFTSNPALQLEFVPFINRIISPPIRPVNSQVIKPEEKALLNRLVNIMAALQLRFFQERAEDGQLSYRLDPPIDVFVTYDGKRAADIAVSRYAVRHLMAKEVGNICYKLNSANLICIQIDAALIARDTDVVEKGRRGKHEQWGATKTKSSEEATDRDATEPRTKRPRTEDNIDIADKPPTDFFGRVIAVNSRSNHKTASSKKVTETKQYRVTYRYIEGCSAAVRKPVKMGAFL